MALPMEFFTNDTLFNLFVGPLIMEDSAKLLGPTAISYPIDALLLGITIHLFTEYYTSQRYGWQNDPCPLKGLVVFTMVLAFYHSAMLFRWQWIICVSNYGQVSSYFRASLLAPLLPSLALTGLVVQLYFVWKAYLFYRKKMIILVACFSIALLSFSAIVGLFVNCFRAHSVIQPDISLRSIQYKLVKIAIISATATNMAITVLISFHLGRQKTSWSTRLAVFYKFIIIFIEALFPITVFAIAVGLNTLSSSEGLTSRKSIVSALECNSAVGQGLTSNGKNLGSISVEVEHTVSVILMEPYNLKQGLNRRALPDLEEAKDHPLHQELSVHRHPSDDALDVTDNEITDSSVAGGSTTVLVRSDA